MNINADLGHEEKQYRLVFIRHLLCTWSACSTERKPADVVEAPSPATLGAGPLLPPTQGRGLVRGHRETAWQSQDTHPRWSDAGWALLVEHPRSQTTVDSPPRSPPSSLISPPLTPATLPRPAETVHFPGTETEVSAAAPPLPSLVNSEAAERTGEECGFGLRHSFGSSFA